ncbi:MAG: GGDEF domain-containing protein [Phycisphaerales bacterium]|nr:MAG: GGDEF domain-containing protein [Phycisphaerales bacterium]
MRTTDLIMTLLLPWFPIILGVGVGGRLLGKTRGFGLGMLCAVFWMFLVHASVGPVIWGDPWTVMATLAGLAAIVAMGGWAGQSPEKEAAAELEPVGAESLPNRQANERDDHCERISTAIDRFEEWLENHSAHGDPWPAFDEFIRMTLGDCCGATHVKPYRLVDEGGELKPLGESDPSTEAKHLSARKGIVGHVVTTGRCYLAGDTTQGELITQLAEEWQEPMAWCFAVREGPHKIGVVIAGQLNVAPEGSRSLLRAMERLISRFWCALRETHRRRAAAHDDPISGAYIREAFFRTADQSLRESYRQGEPVALAVVALEKLREINDSGHWEVADELVREVSGILRRKIRVDDQLGRFDGSRFMILLRRVDSELASLIIAQIMSQLTELCANTKRWGASVVVRCGVAGSGTASPDLRTLVSKALTQCRRARMGDAQVASDLQASGELIEATL